MASPPSTSVYLEAMAPAKNPHSETQTTWRPHRRSDQPRKQSQRPMAHVTKLGHLHGHDNPVANRLRTIQSIKGVERACFQETNRLVRIRMLGGVGGSPGQPGPYPDRIVRSIKCICECGTAELSYYKNSNNRSNREIQ